jgi:thiamine pyrophosphate-dependent acetolactate synthase large subunit-like protein
MNALDKAHSHLLSSGIEFVTSVPDSALAPLSARIAAEDSPKYIQAAHEAGAIGIAAGMTLAGTKALVMMENSGLRTGCETLARLQTAHGVFICCLISHRGAFGERNWWGQAHHETMTTLLPLLRFRWRSVYCVADLPAALDEAYRTLAAGQCGSAIIAEPSFTRELRL